MLLALWFDFWDSAAWVPPVLADYWCALTGQTGYTAGGDICEM